MKKKVVGYARVSTEKQDLERQKILIREYCADSGYELIKIISEKVSGAKKDRQSINELLDIDGSVADMVVVSELSRISRQKELMAVLNTINEILENGLDVLFLDDTTKIYSAYAELDMVDIITLTVKAHSAAEERDKITTRMKTGKLTKVSTNPYMYTGGVVPYGFKVIDNPKYEGQKNNIPAKRLMVLDESKSKDIHLIYQLVLNGTTLRDAAKEANRLGLITQQNKPFCETSISKMIKNPIYNGRRRFKNLDLEIEKIIPDEDWNRAQICVSKNQLFKGKATKNFNPLKGIIFCPCGYALMLHKMVKKNGSSYFVLACCKKNDKEYRSKCRNSGTTADSLLPTVWKCVKSTLLLSEYLTKTKSEVNRINSIIDSLEDKIIVLVEEISTHKKEMTRLAKAITLVTVTGLIEQYQNEYIINEAKVNELEGKIQTVKNEITAYKDEINRVNTIKKDSELVNLTEQEKADIYKKVLSRVVYYSEDYFRGFIVISYKNGLENIVAINKTVFGYISPLPSSFGFNVDKRTITVQVSKKQPSLKSFSSGDIETREYNFKEMESNFDLKQWNITK
ncbi:recombinase family protein [Bacteroides thetaiotaomicron]|uniref:recombinase family protein n=1 Tax=Bacteroides thetaiotaomicron TaxID=818 RepID=UPI001C378498|nr:recombinase family protein [Bacteroides thetaiotaomicron]MBV4088410.1 recombinase family protein [Bacteroides thetaiotaomicron]MBV4100246.1 recombinase family protein [Bacteroides thetaiotaomicron]MBV4135975.1 recombinase family protein [Bacteroides thetaiotaomicron]UVV52772.1 recombinase family protein [Bacteroides thetaiotaomicron]